MSEFIYNNPFKPSHRDQCESELWRKPVGVILYVHIKPYCNAVLVKLFHVEDPHIYTYQLTDPHLKTYDRDSHRTEDFNFMDPQSDMHYRLRTPI